MIITKDALKILAMNNASCKVFGQKRILNLKYLTQCARMEKDFDYEQLVVNLPESGVMYGSIESFAKLLKKKQIDEEVLLKFLGGQWHIQYVKDQMEIANSNSKFDQDFINKFFFSHILLVAEMTSVDDCLKAVYKNKQVLVEIKNLVTHPFLKKQLAVGQKVLLHQALILEADPDTEIEKLLFFEQSRSEDFLKTAGQLQLIDYSEFWDLQAWTREVVYDL